jgi:hypothetical protein
LLISSTIHITNNLYKSCKGILKRGKDPNLLGIKVNSSFLSIKKVTLNGC